MRIKLGQRAVSRSIAGWPRWVQAGVCRRWQRRPQQIELFPPERCRPDRFHEGFYGGLRCGDGYRAGELTVSPGRLVLDGANIARQGQIYAIDSILVLGLGSDYETAQRGS